MRNWRVREFKVSKGTSVSVCGIGGNRKEVITENVGR